MKRPVAIEVNGVQHSREVEPRLLLVHFLRETLGLTGTNVGCDTSQCGACTVLIDGQAVKSCTVLAVQADGAKVTTDRGAGHGRQAAPAAGGVLGEARPAVRLLHAGHDHDRLRPAAAQPAPERGRDPPRHRRQLLPLHRLPEHRRGGGAGRRADDRRAAAAAGRRPRERLRGGTMASRIFGSGIKRREDPRLITGQAKYTDDIMLPGMAHAGRRAQSPHAHARITRDRRLARRASVPGVLAVYTGADMKDAGFGGIPCAWVVPELRDQDAGVSADRHRHRPLRRRRGGDRGGRGPLRRPRRRRRGRGGLRAAAGGRRRQEGRAARRAAAPRRRCRTTSASTGRSAAATSTRPSASADVVGQGAHRQPAPDPQRHGAARRRSRSTTPAMGELTLWVTIAEPAHRPLPALAGTLGMPEHKIRVIAPEVGGGFGSKIPHYPEDIDGGLRRQDARAAGQVDGDAQRELPGDDPRPRPRAGGRDGGTPATARSSASAPPSGPTSAPTSRPPRPASRRSSTG